MTQGNVYLTKTNTLTVFSTRTTTTPTSLDETLTELLKLQKPTGTLHLLLQRLYPCKGTSETIARILQPYNIRVAHKPITTLRHLLTNVKDKDETNNRQGAVYKIKCSDCQASDIGRTGKNINTRLTEHKRATRNGDVNNHISEHHRLTNHKIDWDSAECLTTFNLQYELFSTTDSRKLVHRLRSLPLQPGKTFLQINRLLQIIYAGNFSDSFASPPGARKTAKNNKTGFALYCAF